jgi:hypothetical protein
VATEGKRAGWRRLLQEARERTCKCAQVVYLRRIKFTTAAAHSSLSLQRFTMETVRGRPSNPIREADDYSGGRGARVCVRRKLVARQRRKLPSYRPPPPPPSARRAPAWMAFEESCLLFAKGVAMSGVQRLLRGCCCCWPARARDATAACRPAGTRRDHHHELVVNGELSARLRCLRRVASCRRSFSSL